jgi:hypothetical protein
MPAKTAVERLDQIVTEHPHSPGSQRVSLTLGEVRDLKARLDWLADMVVAAAALNSGELSRQEREYVEEELRLVAADLAKSGPRYIPGKFKGGRR